MYIQVLHVLDFIKYEHLNVSLSGCTVLKQFI